MATTVGDFIVERLHQWGVRRMFGYPGDGINGVFGALNRAEGKIEFVQARHEEMAAFMASAHAKFTGELGVCIATSGPGASHLITGLYDARMDHMPVLAIVGQQARAALGSHYQQELDLAAMFKDVAGSFAMQASVPAQVRHLVDRAIRIALSERRVTALILPNDLQDLEYEPPARKHGTAHSGVGYSRPRVVPMQYDLEKAAEVLNAGRKVAILVGAGGLNATDEVIAVADDACCVVKIGKPHTTTAMAFFIERRQCDSPRVLKRRQLGVAITIAFAARNLPIDQRREKNLFTVFRLRNDRFAQRAQRSPLHEIAPRGFIGRPHTIIDDRARGLIPRWRRALVEYIVVRIRGQADVGFACAHRSVSLSCSAASPAIARAVMLGGAGNGGPLSMFCDQLRQPPWLRAIPRA